MLHRLCPLALLLVFLVCTLATAEAGASSSTVYLPLVVGSAPTSSSVSLAETALILTNEQRALHGCGPLTLNPQLTSVAQNYSMSMALNDFFDHIGPDGQTLSDRVNATGYAWQSLAENLAAGQITPQEVINSWMQSPGHRGNILNCNLQEVGIGYYFQNDDQANVRLSTSEMSGPFGHYWTQTFATPR